MAQPRKETVIIDPGGHGQGFLRSGGGPDLVGEPVVVIGHSTGFDALTWGGHIGHLPAHV